jgi:hypothetical protein
MGNQTHMIHFRTTENEINVNIIIHLKNNGSTGFLDFYPWYAV